MIQKFRVWRKKIAAFVRAKGGNVAMMFGLSLVPITLAAGGGLDFARAMMVRSAMTDALDAAALAVGTTPGMSSANALKLAQNYVNANYTQDKTQYGTPTVTSVSIDSVKQTVTMTVTDAMPTTLLKVGGLMPVINLTVNSTVTWGQTKLWVALVLDNTGSMSQTDSTGTSKISALKTASHNLITTLQNASTTVGDVQMTITPFSKLVNIGTGYVNSTGIDWTDWEAEPVDKNGNPDPPDFSTGPGSSCPYTTGSDGFVCMTKPTNGSTTSTVPNSGTYKGYICPGVMQSYNAATGTGGHYFNGCYTSVAGTQTSSNTICSGHSYCSCSGYSNCTCSGSGTNRVCTQTTTTNGYNHAWVHNAHSTWGGCIMDRNKNGDNGATEDYDADNTVPVAGSAKTGYPAANDDNCPPSTVTPLPASWTAGQWTTLGNQIDNMAANGSTNQTIGLANGWETLTPNGLYSAPPVPANTSGYIILVSDGLNTQDRWYGDGSNQSGPATTTASVDYRMSLACANAKLAGFKIFTVFVDLGGTQGNSAVLQSCATDSSYYFDLTTSGAIVTTFAIIAQRITNLRVSQ